MAQNPGVGNKFVSVNLNKSYGQRALPSSSPNVGPTSRARSAAGTNGGGGGSGMVVLSRSRSSIVGAPKGGPKLSVPPPLNLPSLRKEHEKFDSLSLGGGAAGGGSSGGGVRPAVASVGWTKPSLNLDKDIGGGGSDRLFGAGSQGVDGSGSDLNSVPGNGGLKNSVYMPPSARSGPVVEMPREYVAVEKAVVLRGEDFPSLHATLPTVSGVSHKQKGGGLEKQSKKVNGEREGSDEQMGGNSGNSYLRPPLVMHPQIQSSLVGKGGDDKFGGERELGGSRTNERFRKQDDIFPSPLPLVRLNHTSDWADDERDTRHGLLDRDRDYGYMRNDSFRDRDIDIHRGSLLPKSDGRGLHDDEFGRPPSREFLRGNSFNRELRVPSGEHRDGSPWRASPIKKDGFGAPDIGFDRNGGVGARPLGHSREMNKESKYSQTSFGYNGRDSFSSGLMANQDSRFGRRDTGYGQVSRQNGNHSVDSYTGRGTEKNQYGSDLRYRGDIFQNNLMPKSSGKALPVNDPILNVGREKRLSSNNQYIEDPFVKEFGSDNGFDGRDPLTGTLVGVLKRKKDIVKQADFHDPVRESFEAELERVQKMQEQERQRVIEEQTRVLELARKEEEEKERLAREEEERRRRLEDEAREAAWRAEQERLEAVRRAEELRITREEEKRRIQLEEERRKEAARQKLLELEARIARRQAEATKDNELPDAVREERMLGVVKGKDVPPRVADVVDWEDGERMVERITSSASSDSSSLNRSFDVGSRPQYYREGDSALVDRGRPANSWRRDTFENGNNSTFSWQDQENGYRSPKRDALGAGRAVRKEFNGAPGVMPASISSKGIPDPYVVDDFSHPRGHRWNLAGDGDHYSGNPDPEFHDNFADKFNDVGWGQGRPRSSSQASYPEKLFQSSDTDGLSSFGRSRYSMRQPRVLPPPSMASMHKNTFRSPIERPSSSASQDWETGYHHEHKETELNEQGGYNSVYEGILEQSIMSDSLKKNTIPLDVKGAEAMTSRCDSQSSLSVSSAPNSPTHLSHDDLEDSGDSPSRTAAEGEEASLSDDENVSVVEVDNSSKMKIAGTVSSVEDEEWTVENHHQLTEQEEYDEEEDGYREEDDVHERDEKNVDLSLEFEALQLEEESSRKMSEVVLGFNEGVEVAIPSGDDFDGTSTTEPHKVSLGVLEEPGSFDGVVSTEQNLQSGNMIPDSSVECSEVTQETEKQLHHSSTKPVNVSEVSAVSADHILGTVEASGSCSLSPQQPLTSSGNLVLPSPIVQPTTSTVSVTPNQSEVPVQLQFGLFSGPSLIPSPVPAIQIGSIQMPLHLHSQVGPSLTQLHPSQPPFFQFGQLRYASPISQGILPLGPQSMSFVQPSVPAHYSLNQNQEGPLKNQAGQNALIENHFINDKGPSVTLGGTPGTPTFLDQSEEDLRKKVNVLPLSMEGERRIRSGSVPQFNEQGHRRFDVKKNYSSIVSNKELQSQLQADSSPSQFISRAPGPMPGSRGKKLVYSVKNSGSRGSLPVSDSPHTDFSGSRRRGRQKIQRTEFRVRENVDKRHREGFVSSNYAGTGERYFNGKASGNYSQSYGQKDAVINKPSKMVESERMTSDSIGLHVDSGIKMEKRPGKEVSVKPHGEGNSKRNNNSEEDVDAPLQSGIVRVFNQPGIEAPSDEDDFIEVRSKRQMLNDRREQREKEIKARSRVVKAPRKRRSVSQNNAISTNSNKISTSFGGEATNRIRSKSVLTNGNGLMSADGSTGFTSSVVSPPLAPIGTPAVNSDAQADSRSCSIKSPQTGPTPVISNGGIILAPGLSFENKNMVLDNAPTSLNPWGNARMNQQVLALTQTQLDEAMKPVRFDTHVATIGDHTTSKLSSSIMIQDKSFSSAGSPLNSLLAGEKIQFGAVTSPTILPTTSVAVSSGLGSPVDHNLSAVESNCTLFFGKDKHPVESCVDFVDPEAEAAASAVAVAAISSDEIVGNSVSGSDTKSFGGTENEGLASEGLESNQQLVSQSRGEESLTVALPADLSVETPSLSLWPSLPSPQNSSGQMLSHFPGGPPSHFPCYEMNPMLGGPVFAFGHDESLGTQSQSQKSSVSSSGPFGAWQQCHSGVDSFYGPPAGFTGPFISPSGGIQGVQGPPHMVVYNHFTPVGQFGQVGLSFMGTTYIPSGKQPDWKHNPASPAMSMGDGEASAQHNPSSMPAQIQHLAPGSPLLPLASPLAMFDMSPFQPPPEVPVQTRWSHVPASPHSASLSMPTQQQHEGALPLQFMDQSIGNRFSGPCSATPECGRNYPVTTSASVGQFHDELGMVDPSTTAVARGSASRHSSTIVNGKSPSLVTKSMTRSAAANTGDNNSSSFHDTSNNNNSSQSMSFAHKSHSTIQQQTSTQQYNNSPGYTDQSGTRVHQKPISGGEWSHRRMGFQGRNQFSGSEKKVSSSKVKQIYVAKPAPSRTTEM